MFFREQIKEILSIFNRIKNRDFKGNKGIAIKNSFFQTSSALTRKFGSLFFTVILARILMPELFGLYSLALSTIVLFSMFSNMGICETIIKHLSKEFARGNNSKAKSYANYLGKIKFILVLISILFIFISAKFLSQTYYQKPLFLALLGGSFYILFLRTTSFMVSILQSKNYFKGVFHKEIVLQISRLFLVPLASLIALRQNFSPGVTIFLIILALSVVHLITAIFSIFIVKHKKIFYSTEKSYLDSKEKSQIKKFLIALSATALSGVFASQIDTIMLGHFVMSEFVGYYQVALSSIAAFFPLIGFSSAILPILSRLNKKRASKALEKTSKLTFFIALPIVILIILFAPFIIKIIYGESYLLATNILRIFSLMLITIPLIDNYKTYFVSIGEPKTLAKLLIFSTIFNIILNYLFIKLLLPKSQLFAVFGVTIATLLSNFLILFLLLFLKKLNTKTS
jgi:O-antigen/teichoic acid export membrane protein